MVGPIRPAAEPACSAIDAPEVDLPVLQGKGAPGQAVPCRAVGGDRGAPAAIPASQPADLSRARVSSAEIVHAAPIRVGETDVWFLLVRVEAEGRHAPRPSHWA